VAVTVAAVAGPYSGVNCTLTLLSSKVRKDSIAGSAYAETPLDGDSRFRYSFGAVRGVATSQAVADSGLFELTFQGDRLLPFEGAGAVSKWRIEIPPATNRFDLRTLTDVILQIQYTARDAGGPLREAALAAALQGTAPLGIPRAVRLLSARNELAAAWTKFESELEQTSNDQVLTFTLDGKLPFIPGRNGVLLSKLRAAVDLDLLDAAPIEIAADVKLTPPTPPGGSPVGPTAIKLRDPSVGLVDISYTPAVGSTNPPTGLVGWTFEVRIKQGTVAQLDPTLTETYPAASSTKRLKPTVLRDLILLLELVRDPPLA
jgi:hypothetical protein